LIGLRGSLFQVHPFETRRRGEDRHCPPRTVGFTNLLLGSAPNGLSVGAQEAVEVALRHPNDPVPGEAAKEKVVFCDRHGQTVVFQADRQKKSAAVCACGNASATAAALLAQRLGRREITQELQVPDGRLEMSSHVTPLAGDAWTVEQSWIGIRFQVHETEMHGRQVAACTGSFNEYLIVRLDGASELEQFDLPDALALWGEGRKLGGFNDPLQSRLVAIASQGGAPPFAKFYTCGRAHPGAPLTGLATIAIASGSVGWLSKLLVGGVIQHRRGLDPLPAVRKTARGYESGFPAIDVFLNGV
jgi:hypothetical protein